MKIVLLLVAVFALQKSSGYSDPNKTTLRLLHVVSSIINNYLLEIGTNFLYFFQFFRHGTRTPDELDMYPKDPYLNSPEILQVGYGQLTKVSYKILGTQFLLNKKVRVRANAT